MFFLTMTVIIIIIMNYTKIIKILNLKATQL